MADDTMTDDPTTVTDPVSDDPAPDDTDYRRMQQRGALTAAEVMASDEIPLEREIIVAVDTGDVWVGDGVTPVSQLTPIKTGLTAYQIWLAEGNTGTVTEYLASLVGPRGPSGDTVPTDEAMAEHLSDPNGLARAALDKRYGIVIPSPGSTVGFSSTLQSLIDLGAKAIGLIGDQTYYLDGPVFQDSADPRRSVRIYTNGARLVVQSGAGAKATGYVDADSIRHLFFDNTLRTALVDGVVTCTNATCATGGAARVGVGLGLYDVDARSEDSDQGDASRLVHTFNSTLEFVGRTSYLAGFAASAGYCDSMYLRGRLTNPEKRSGAVAVAYRQRGNGDNLFMHVNADARALSADLRYCRGAQIYNVGGGLKFSDCSAIKTHSHIEGDETYRTTAPLTVTRSEVTPSGELWKPRASQGILGTIVVNDGSAAPDGSTMLNLEGLTVRDVYRPNSESTADERSTPTLYLQAVNYGTRIRARGLFEAINRIASDASRYRFAPAIAGASAYATAIAGAASLLASGEWDMNGTASGGVRFSSPGDPAQFVKVLGRTSPPRIDSVVSTTDVLGALADGTYTYVVVILDEAGGNSTVASSQVTLSSGSNAARLIVSGLSGSRIGVWRRAGTTGPYTAYAEFGVSQAKVFLWDTGTNINRRPWSSTIPAVPTAATSADAVIWNGRTVTLG